MEKYKEYCPVNDYEALREFGISCNAGNTERNIIILSENQSVSDHRDRLSVEFTGSDNRLLMKNAEKISGKMSFVGEKSEASLEGRDVIFITAFLYSGSKIRIDPCFSIFGLLISAYEKTSVIISKDCLIAEGVSFWTFDHHAIIDLKTNKQTNKPKDIVINSHVWIGRSATILKGSHIGCGSVVSAGSVIRGVVPPGEVWGGNPARCFRKKTSWTPSHPTNPFDLERMRLAIEGSSSRATFRERIRSFFRRISK